MRQSWRSAFHTGAHDGIFVGRLKSVDIPMEIAIHRTRNQKYATSSSKFKMTPAINTRLVLLAIRSSWTNSILTKYDDTFSRPKTGLVKYTTRCLSTKSWGWVRLVASFNSHIPASTKKLKLWHRSLTTQQSDKQCCGYIAPDVVLNTWPARYLPSVELTRCSITTSFICKPFVVDNTKAKATIRKQRNIYT